MSTGIKVLSAIYASDLQGYDVTGDCQQIAAKTTIIPVNDGTFGDPDSGRPKSFTITFVLPGGQTQYMGCGEKTNLNLIPA